jgi:hypothetical protein
MSLDDLVHSAFDFFNVLRFVIANLGSLFSYLFTPLAGLFNFAKGFFVGIATPPPTTEMTLGWATPVMTIFNAIPHFSLFCWACGAGVAILVLIFIFRRLVEF